MPAFQEYFDPSHQLVRDSVRRFVEREILPDIDQWEEAESFPRELYLKAGQAGILGIGYPEAFGGSHEGDLFAKVAASEELMRCGSGGLVAGLGSLDIGLPPILKWARPEVRDRVVPQVLSGEKISALAVTEPSGGSDVANLQTRAVREGDVYFHLIVGQVPGDEERAARDFELFVVLYLDGERALFRDRADNDAAVFRQNGEKELL